MKIVKYSPLITTTKKLSEIREFYTSHLGFKTTMDIPNYLGLTSMDGSVELGFMPPEPGESVFAGAGFILCLQVPSADAEHERLVGRGLRVTRRLTSNDWGDRSFVVEDPAGMSLYIHHPIPPAGKYAQTAP